MAITEGEVVEHHDIHHFPLLPARPFPFGTLAAAAATVVQGAGLWMGYAIEENAGAPAFARAVIGDGANNAIVLPFGPYTFGAQQSRDDMWPGHGVLFQRGLTVQCTAGSINGSLWAVLLTRDQIDYINRTRTGEGV